MDVDREQQKRMRAVGVALSPTGLALMGWAVDRLAVLSQMVGQNTAWWPIPLLVLGSVMLVVGLLLIIVPPKRWKGLWLAFRGFPAWLREVRIWGRCELTYEAGVPKIDHQLSQDGQTRQYTAIVRLLVSVSEKAKDYLPLGISVAKSTTFFVLEQNRGLASVHPVTLEVVPGTARETLLTTPGTHPYVVAFSASQYNNPSIVFVDLEQPYTWTLKGVTANLANVRKTRQLRAKGKCTS